MSSPTTALPSSGGSSRKVSRLLELQLDDELLRGLQCLDAVSASGGSNTHHNHTSSASSPAVASSTLFGGNATIKGIVEQQALASYEQLLAALGDADRRYLDVAESVSTLAAEGQRARDLLSKCSAASGELLGKIDGLVAELAEVQQREQRISAFIRSFQISDADAVTLRHGEVTAEFLAALSKLQHIHDSCRKYVAQQQQQQSEGGDRQAQQQFEQQQAAVEVMESTFLLHMGAMEKLAVFVGNTAPEVCGGSAAIGASESLSGASADHAALLVDAVRALQSNPSMWAKAVHEIARVRRGALLRRLGSHTTQLVREAAAKQQQQQQHQTGAGRRSAAAGSDGGGASNTNAVSLRLLGDLCAWLDETAAEEKESAAAFFFSSSGTAGGMGRRGEQHSSTSSLDAAGSGADSEQSRQLTSSTSAHFTLQDYLDSVFDAAARQLKLRAVETVNEMSEAVWPRHSSSAAAAASGGASGSSSVEVGSSSGGGAGAGGMAGPLSILADYSKVHALVALYKSESLFGFYGSRVSSVFGASSAVVSALNDARLESMRLFYELLSGVSTALRTIVDSTTGNGGSSTGGGGGGGKGGDDEDDASSSMLLPDGLVPHPSAASACGLLRALLQVIETSPAPQAQRVPEAAPLLSALLDPISKMIEAGSGSVSSSTRTVPPDFSVYAINTLCVALSCVLPFDFTSQRQQALTDLLESTVLAYIKTATARTSERLELDVALKLISQAPRPTKDSAALAMKVFFAGIFAGDGICPLPVPHLEDIQPVRVRERCRKEVVAQVVETYEKIYAIVSNDIEPDADARKLILHHTPEQLKLLLE